MHYQINLRIWRQNCGGAIIRAGAIIGTNTVFRFAFRTMLKAARTL